MTIVERRAPWREDFGPEWTRSPIARLRYVQRTGVWTLYWRDRNACWHRYDRVGPSARIEVLLDELDADPTGIFWGEPLRATAIALRGRICPHGPGPARRCHFH